MQRLILFFLASLLLVACAAPANGHNEPTPTPQVLPDPTEALSQLMNALRAAGGAVELTADTVPPLVEPRLGKILLVNAQPLAVFEFGSTAEADKAALALPADASLEANFFRTGRLLIRYAWDDSAVWDVLTRAVGQPFAGARRPTGQCGAWHTSGAVSIALEPSFCIVWSDPLEDETGFRLTLTYPNTQEIFTYTVEANTTAFIVPEAEAAAPTACQRWSSFSVEVTALTPNGEVPYGLMATDSECAAP